MADTSSRPKIVFRPSLAGLATFLTGMLILLVPRGFRNTEPPALLLGLGLLAILLLSFLFLLGALPFLYRRVRRQGFSAEALPAILPVGQHHHLEVDPPRPGFLPGVRLTTQWKLGFGPLRRNIRVGLAPRGKTSADITSFRRGLWTGRYMLEASDPFGLFVLELIDPEIRQMLSPPSGRELAGDGIQGRPSYDSASALRPKDDAEELLERREYHPGDDTRRLDWKQMARTGDMLVRIGDDSVPLQGRVWIEVIAGTEKSSKRISGRQLLRLDSSLLAADALVRRLIESGQEAMVRLPGETGWKSAFDEDWTRRLASSLPSHGPGSSAGPSPGPATGDQCWIISHPRDYLGFRVTMLTLVALPGKVLWENLLPSGTAADAVSRGRAMEYRISMGFPAAAPVAVFYTRLLDRASRIAGGAGSDVRHL